LPGHGGNVTTWTTCGARQRLLDNYAI